MLLLSVTAEPFTSISPRAKLSARVPPSFPHTRPPPVPPAAVTASPSAAQYWMIGASSPIALDVAKCVARDAADIVPAGHVAGGVAVVDRAAILADNAADKVRAVCLVRVVNQANDVAGGVAVVTVPKLYPATPPSESPSEERFPLNRAGGEAARHRAVKIISH